MKKIRYLFSVELNGNRSTEVTPECFLSPRDYIKGIKVYSGEKGKEIYECYIAVEKWKIVAAAKLLPERRKLLTEEEKAHIAELKGK
jgi:hypothetical protein